MRHMDAALSEEICRAVKDLPLYQGGPGFDYTEAPVAYAVNITLVHLRRLGWARLFRRPKVTPDTLALVVERASGHGRIGSWSGVTGYIDTIADPRPREWSRWLRARSFDPLRYTIRNELMEECGLSKKDIDRISFYLGKRFVVTSHNGGTLHIMPILGICRGPEPPPIIPNPSELSNAVWAPISQIHAIPGVSSGYVSNTLPRALSAHP